MGQAIQAHSPGDVKVVHSKLAPTLLWHFCYLAMVPTIYAKGESTILELLHATRGEKCMWKEHQLPCTALLPAPVSFPGDSWSKRLTQVSSFSGVSVVSQETDFTVILG